ncbi:MAG: hypothetical protein U9Q98_08715 [Bacteroidota bacterium]|nr:hypothetical protein [Bacteroidota bacterium]
MMKQIALGIVMLILAGNIFAQADDYYSPASDSSFNFSLQEGNETSLFNNQAEHKTTFHPTLSMGGSAYSFNGTPSFSSYISPALQINPPGKFSFFVGTSMSYSNIHSDFLMFPESKEGSYFEKMAAYHFYASGAYQVSNKLNIHGGASVTMLPGSDNQTLKNGHIGFDYHIGDNSHIRADFNFGDGMPWYYYGNNASNMHNRSGSMPGFGYGSRHPFMY